MLVIRPTSNVNTPAISTGTSVTVLSANANRTGWFIQNLAQTTMYICLGGTASTSVFHFALKGGTANDDGTAGSVSQMSGVVYTGAITAAPASGTLRYVVLEHAG